MTDLIHQACERMAQEFKKAWGNSVRGNPKTLKAMDEMTEGVLVVEGITPEQWDAFVAEYKKRTEPLSLGKWRVNLLDMTVVRTDLEEEHADDLVQE